MEISQHKRIVIKIGSSLFIEEGKERKDWLRSLIADVAGLKAAGKDIIIVSSGAIAFGRNILRYGSRVLSVEEKQAAAACGQISLMAMWSEYLAAPGVNLYPAQLLLTGDDSANRRRYLNTRNTLDTLLSDPRIVPIVNENDTVTTAEIRFGDNDRLSARVAQMASADLLILLSDVDGLYSADPRTHKDAKFIERVEKITPEIESYAGGVGSSVGTGGMVTKLAAAKIATSAGCNMMIARGDGMNPLRNLSRHTYFEANDSPMSARKRWISGDMHPAGTITVDDGAKAALAQGKSLLPAGVKAVNGEFSRGDTVALMDLAGAMLGKGLIAYDSDDAKAIIGRKSQEIEALLGFKGRDVLIHRDDMVLEK